MSRVLAWSMAAALAATTATSMAQAPAGGAWPGLWGPARNGDAPAPAASPAGFRELWRRPSAGGYSEVAVAGDVVVSMELRAGADFVIALDAATGRERWATRVAATYKGHDGSNDGPIATPAVDGDQVFALGPHGHLLALELATGREQWRHDFVRDFGAAMPDWGFGASPLVSGDRVIVPTGGPNNHRLLALDRVSGCQAGECPSGKNPGDDFAGAVTIASTPH